MKEVRGGNEDLAFHEVRYLNIGLFFLLIFIFQRKMYTE